MQIHSRFQVSQRKKDDRRGCKGVQDTHLPPEKKTDESLLSQLRDHGDIPKHVQTKEVVFAISKLSGCRIQELLSKRRSQLITPFRHLLYYILRRYTYRTFPEIGRDLDRDHTTIIIGARRGKELIDNNAKMKSFFEDVLKELGVSKDD